MDRMDLDVRSGSFEITRCYFDFKSEFRRKLFLISTVSHIVCVFLALVYTLIFVGILKNSVYAQYPDFSTAPYWNILPCIIFGITAYYAIQTLRKRDRYSTIATLVFAAFSSFLALCGFCVQIAWIHLHHEAEEHCIKIITWWRELFCHYLIDHGSGVTEVCMYIVFFVFVAEICASMTQIVMIFHIRRRQKAFERQRILSSVKPASKLSLSAKEMEDSIYERRSFQPTDVLPHFEERDDNSERTDRNFKNFMEMKNLSIRMSHKHGYGNNAAEII